MSDVAHQAAISLAYLSEIERGRKDVSSELLGAVSDALDLSLVTVLERCVDRLSARHTALLGDRPQSGLRLQLLAA